MHIYVHTRNVSAVTEHELMTSHIRTDAIHEGNHDIRSITLLFSVECSMLATHKFINIMRNKFYKMFFFSESSTVFQFRISRFEIYHIEHLHLQQYYIYICSTFHSIQL